MKSTKFLAIVLVVAAGLAAAIVSLAFAEQSSEAPSAGKTEMHFPPNWTKEDIDAMMAAATPGKMQERLVKEAGVWRGKTTMWMYPGAEPITSEGISTITPILDGRYTRCEMKGELPGMGPYHGIAIYGFDNVMQQFVSTWIDNHSTGIANGVGQLSDDGKTITWQYTAPCPITKKAVVMREIETNTGPNTKTLEMFGADPKTGKEFQMMRIELTRE